MIKIDILLNLVVSSYSVLLLI